MPDAAHTRDHRRYGRRFKAELQCGVGQIRLRRTKHLTNRFHTPHGPLEPIPGEVVAADFARLPDGLRRQFARQRAFVIGNADDDAHIAPQGLGKQLRLCFLVEDVVDHLYAIDPAVPHQVQDGVLIVLGCRNADGSKLALFLGFAKNRKRARIVVPCPGPRVNLHEIDAIGPQRAETLLQLLSDVAFRESLVHRVVRAGRPIARQDRRNLRGEVGTLARPLLQRLANHLLASAVAVGASRVDEIAAQLKDFVERGHGVAIVLLPPLASSQGPGAHADFRHLPIGSSKSAISHVMRVFSRWTGTLSTW